MVIEQAEENFYAKYSSKKNEGAEKKKRLKSYGR
jgi:hypothetical protein